MATKVSYEWDIETVDAHGDIQDHHHADKLIELTRLWNDGPDVETTRRIVLVRDVICEIDGLIDRTWAYVEDGVLPEYFADSLGEEATKVPKRLHREFSRGRSGFDGLPSESANLKVNDGKLLQ